jgi:peroxiredoxin
MDFNSRPPSLTLTNEGMTPMTPRWRPWLLTAPLWLAVGGSLTLGGCGAAERAPQSTFRLLDGSTLTSVDLAGRVLLVNFWATTCVSCVKEMPQLVELHRRYHARGFETVAVAMSYDPPEWVANFTRTRQLPFKVALDTDGSLARDWGEVKLTPTTYIVDRQGRIVKRYVGEPDFNALAALLEKLLAQG